MNEDEQIVWGQPISFLDFVLGFLAAPNLRRVELVPKTDPLKFYIREKVAPPSQDLGEIRDANKERVNKSLSNYASNNFLLSTSNIRPDLNGKYNPGLGLFAGDLTALALSMGFDPFNASNYYKVATQIPKFRNWGFTRLLANELNNEVRVAGELGKNVGKSTVNPIIRTKIGDVEINNPELYYHLSGLGKAKNFFNTNRMRTPQEEYWLKLEHVPLELRAGITPGFPQNPGKAMFSLGKLWYGLDPEQFPDLLVTAKEMPTANSKAGIVRGSLLKLYSQGTRRVTSDNVGSIGPHTNQNTSAYTYVPEYGYRQIQLEPRTSLKFFERPLSKISLTEKMGIPKGERNNLNLFLKEALTDLDQYIKSGLYRLYPTINMDTAEPFWGTKYGNEPAIKQLILDGVPSVRGRGQEWLWNRPNGGTYDLVTDGLGNFGIGYSSYGMFDVSPEFNVRVGEASAGSAKNGYSKIFLTAPKNDAIHFITETPELEIAKKALIETLSPRINKTIMKDFWSGVLLSLKPGAYLSGDEGTLPKGATLIRLFKELSKGAYKRDNSGKIIGSGRTNWEDIRNSLMKPEKWKRREDGLSTDSYLALLKLAKRENSPYYLRYSPDGFTTFNSQSIDNKFISDLLEKTKTGEATQQEFLKAFHDWVSPYNGIDAKIVNNEIVIPHPFLYKKKKGGKFRK